MSKAADAFRTISEVADDLDVPKHVLRFWENRFPQIKPMKRGGGRRYYRPADMELLRGIQHLLHNEGYTIKGVQKILREQGVETVKGAVQSGALEGQAAAPGNRRGEHPPAATGRRSARSGLRALSGGRRAGGSDRATIIAAAIKELEACRTLLKGERSGAVAPATQRRRARG